jgi:hypothetical protein
MVGQVVIEVNGILINLLEGFRLIGSLETFTKLRYVKDVMELGQLRG